MFETLAFGYGLLEGPRVDAHDRLYFGDVTNDGGCVLRYTSQGRLDRRLDVPAKAVTSLCFGGADRRNLYVVTADNTDTTGRKGSIFRCRVDVPGLPITPASI